MDEDIANDDELAHVTIQLNELPPGKVLDKWYDMENDKKGKVPTKIHLVLHLGEKGQPAFQEDDLPNKALNVHIVEAADVPKADLVGKTDPFCRFGIHGGIATEITSTKDNTSTPIWNEKYVVPLNDPRVDSFVILLFDKDASADDLISQTMVPLSKYKEGEIIDDWWELSPVGKFKNGGRIHLKLQINDAGKPAFE